MFSHRDLSDKAPTTLHTKKGEKKRKKRKKKRRNFTVLVKVFT